MRKLDKLQFRLYGWVLKLRKVPEETNKQYGARKAVALIALGTQRWSEVYARSMMGWVAHMQRHEDSWAYKAFNTQNYLWLAERREQHSSNAAGAVSRTRTRAETGKVFRQDSSGWTLLCDPQTTSDPQATRDPAELARLAEKLPDHLRVKH